MARKKIDDTIIHGLGKQSDKLVVQKSLALFSLWQSKLTLPEFKILDVYLSRINSHEPQRKTVTFTKGELEDILGLKQIKPEVLDQRLANLMTSVRVEQNEDMTYFVRITLFEKAEAKIYENGQWTVELQCTQSAAEYIFNIESIGYLRYNLRSIVSLTSRYSYIMFMYLRNGEQKHYGKSWEISVSGLKALLGCNEATYTEYWRFNDLVLKKVQKELHEKTAFRYTYESIKSGKRVVAIRFTVQKSGADYFAAKTNADKEMLAVIESDECAMREDKEKPERKVACEKKEPQPGDAEYIDPQLPY